MIRAVELCCDNTGLRNLKRRDRKRPEGRDLGVEEERLVHRTEQKRKKPTSYADLWFMRLWAMAGVKEDQTKVDDVADRRKRRRE